MANAAEAISLVTALARDYNLNETSANEIIKRVTESLNKKEA